MMLGRVLSALEALGARARERCVERYSFHAARRELFPLIERVLADVGVQALQV